MERAAILVVSDHRKPKISNSPGTPEYDIKKLAYEQGVMAVGITSVEEFNKYAPEGHQPQDILKGAESLVVVGLKALTGGYWHSPNSRAMGVYRSGLRKTNMASQAIADFIQVNYGYYSVRALNSDPMSELGPLISFKLAAELAGLGTRSLAGGIILNPRFGILYYDAAITAMPLQSDGPLREPVCPAPSCVKMWEKKRTTPCLDAGKAFDCLDGELENGRIKVMKYDNIACAAQQYKANYRSFQIQLARALDEPDREKRRNIILGQDFSRVTYNMSLGEELFASCFECMRFCPVGIKHRNSRGADDMD